MNTRASFPVTTSRKFRSKLGRRFFPMAALLLVPSLGACETMPPPEAILEGAWQLVKDSDAGGTKKTVIEIDSNGQVTAVTDVDGGVSVRQDNATGTVELNGRDITIKTSTNLLFEGTFNEQITVAEGERFTQFSILGVTTTISEGAATLSRDD